MDLKIVLLLLISIGFIAFGMINTASGSQFAILCFLVVFEVALLAWQRRAAAMKIVAAGLVIRSVLIVKGDKRVDSAIRPGFGAARGL